MRTEMTPGAELNHGRLRIKDRAVPGTREEEGVERERERGRGSMPQIDR